MRRSLFRDSSRAPRIFDGPTHFWFRDSSAGTRCAIDRTETKHRETFRGASAPRWGAVLRRECISTASRQSNFRKTVRRGNSANAAVPRQGREARHDRDTHDWCTGVMKCEVASHFSQRIPHIQAARRLSTGDIDFPFVGTNSRGMRHVFGQRKSLTIEFSRAYRRPALDADLRSGRMDSANRHRGIDDRGRCKKGGLVAYRSGAVRDLSYRANCGSDVRCGCWRWVAGAAWTGLEPMEA
jgi:hypothetical protein